MNKKIILMTSILTAMPGYALATEKVPFIDELIKQFNSYPGNQEIDISYVAESFIKSDDGNELAVTGLNVTLKDPSDNTSALFYFDNFKTVGSPLSPNYIVWFNGLRPQINNPTSELFGINNFLNIINENGGIESTFETILTPNEYSFKNMIDVSGMAQFEIKYATYSIDNTDLTTIDWAKFEVYGEGDEEAMHEVFKKFGIDYIEIKIKDNGIVDYILENVVNKGLPYNSIDRMNRSDLATLVKMQSMRLKKELSLDTEKKQLFQSFTTELIQLLEDNKQMVIKIDSPNNNTSLYDEFVKDTTLENPESF